MTNELSKAISTCAIWAATAAIFIFGVFRMNGDFMFFFVAILGIAGAAGGSTAAIWYRPPPPGLAASPPTGGDEDRGTGPRDLRPREEHGFIRRPGD